MRAAGFILLRRSSSILAPATTTATAKGQGAIEAAAGAHQEHGAPGDAAMANRAAAYQSVRPILLPPLRLLSPARVSCRFLNTGRRCTALCLPAARAAAPRTNRETIALDNRLRNVSRGASNERRAAATRRPRRSTRCRRSSPMICGSTSSRWAPTRCSPRSGSAPCALSRPRHPQRRVLLGPRIALAPCASE